MNAVVALGSNLGDSIQTLRQAVQALQALPGTQVCAVSSVYRTVPVGYADQPDFYNAVVALQTSLSPHALLGACLGIEATLGRKRSFANAPRTLDLDLLWYADTVMQSTELTLPHPRMLQRAFVLVPLAQLFPQGQLSDFSFAEALAQVDQSGISAPLDEMLV